MPKEQPNKIVTKKHLARVEKEAIQNKWIMTAAIAIIVIVVFVLGYGILDQQVLRGQQPIAKVDGDVVTTNEFSAFVRYYRWQVVQQYQSTAQMAQMFGTDPNYASYFQNSLTQIEEQLNTPSIIGEQVKNQLIEDRIIRHEAAKRGITVTEEELDKALEEAFGYYPDGTPTPVVFPTAFPTSTLSPQQEEWIATLQPTTGPAPTALATAAAPEPTAEPTAAPEPTASGPTATVAPLPTATPYTEEGFTTLYNQYLDKWKTDAQITEADLRMIYESALYREKLQDVLSTELKPVEEQVWARHILVDTVEEARSVIERLGKGENFIALAAELSKDTSNKDLGGDLGWFGKGSMVAEFEDAAFALGVGEISEPVKTTFGFHVIQVLGHEEKAVDEATFNTLKSTALSDWLTEQKAVVKIEEFDRWKTEIPEVPDLTILQQQ
jgi:parvulin-like peptidyl-prolyl isomerase